MDNFNLAVLSGVLNSNTLSAFTVHLPLFIQLSGDYEVSLDHSQCPTLTEPNKKGTFFFVLCDTMRSQWVNNDYMPLLAVVSAKSIIKAAAYRQSSSFQITSRKEFDRLEFSIRDFSDKTVSFKEGTSVIQVRFRRKLNHL